MHLELISVRRCPAHARRADRRYTFWRTATRRMIPPPRSFILTASWSSTTLDAVPIARVGRRMWTRIKLSRRERMIWSSNFGTGTGLPIRRKRPSPFTKSVWVKVAMRAVSASAASSARTPYRVRYEFVRYELRSATLQPSPSPATGLEGSRSMRENGCA